MWLSFFRVEMIKIFVKTVLILSLVVVGWYFWSSSSFIHPDYNWVRGCKQSYKLSLQSRAHYASPGLNDVSLLQKIEAILNVHILDIRDGEIYLAMQLSSVKASYNGEEDPGLNTIYQIPFLVEMDSSGRISSVTIANAVSEQDGAVIQGIIESLEIIVPDRSDSEWELQQVHSTGTYLARYSYDKEQGLIYKRKKSYVSLNRDSFSSDAVAAIRKSGFQVRLGKHPNCWIESLDGQERIKIAASNDQIRFEMNLALELMEGWVNANLEVWNDSSYDQMRDKLLMGRKNVLSRAKQAGIEKIARELEGSVQELNALLKRYSSDMASGDMMGLKDEISNYLLAFPQQVQTVSDWLRDSVISEDTHAFLVYVLQMTDNKEAQTLIAELAVDSSQSKEKRLRAISALGFVEDPDPALAETIWQLSKQSDDKDVSDRATLIYGAVARQMQQRDPLAAAQVHRNLSGELNESLKSGESEKSRQLLLALGNTAYPGIIQDVELGLASADPGIRCAAAEALASVDDEFASGILEQQLAVENEGKVREQLYRGLLKREFSQKVCDHAKKHLVSEQDENARLAMVEYLVKHRGNDPEIHAVLDKQRVLESNSLIYNKILQGLH